MNTPASQTEVNRDIIIQCITEAPTLQVLNFWGECLRVHKLHDMPHTRDEKFMDRCRRAFVERRNWIRDHCEDYDFGEVSKESGDCVDCQLSLEMDE